MLFSAQDVVTQKFFIERSEADDERKRNDYRLLNDMVEYAHTSDCLQRAIVRYFGQDGGEPCGRCSSCTDERELRDVTDQAKLVFACVSAMKQRFGITLTAKVLRGASDAKVRQFGFDSLPWYGRLGSLSEKEIVQLIHGLVADGYLKLTDSQYPVVQLAAKVRGVMSEGEQVFQRIEPQQSGGRASSRSRSGGGASALPPADAELFERLREVRKALATREGVPPFIIFGDATLREMCALRPTSEHEMRRVKGVGDAKLEKYGEAFAEAIRAYEEG